MNASRTARALAGAALALALVACGGGGGSDAGVTPPPQGNTDEPLADNAPYSSAADGALSGATEAAAVTHASITLGGATINYTARAGHLIARDPASNQAEASFFYVAYTADGASAATRPVTFFYNGGPGSATVWLHLGSYGPRRLATGVPRTTAPRPFAMVANAESLLDTSDLVFVNAVGTGLSTAIAPFSNRSFWSVDADAAVMRDFIVRWLNVNSRMTSPKFLFGESYGGPRTAVLAPLLFAAGVRIDGMVLQSPALDYNSNCGVTGSPIIPCAGYLPSYGAVALSFALVSPLPTSLDAFIAELRGFTDTSYAPALSEVLRGAAVPANLPPRLANYTGLPASRWHAQFNLDPDTFMRSLLPGQILGRYDGRIAAPLGSALAVDGDPSSTLIVDSFGIAIASELRETLRYSATATYVLLSNAINGWNFSHAGRGLPDTVPDIATALAQNAALRVLAISGVHDLATPFHQTELDLARLGASGRVAVRNFAGGHMSYLDDSTRAQQKAELAAFYRATTTARSATALAVKPGNAGVAVKAVMAVDSAGVPDGRSARPEPALQAPLRDPWVPPGMPLR